MTLSCILARSVAVLSLIAVLNAQPRIVVVEESLAADGSLRYQRRDIGRIAGAIRVSVPEGGFHALVLTQAG